MQIIIDTQKDSKEDLKKLTLFLKSLTEDNNNNFATENFLNTNNNTTSENSNQIMEISNSSPGIFNMFNETTQNAIEQEKIQNPTFEQTTPNSQISSQTNNNKYFASNIINEASKEQFPDDDADIPKPKPKVEFY